MDGFSKCRHILILAKRNILDVCLSVELSLFVELIQIDKEDSDNVLIPLEAMVALKLRKEVAQNSKQWEKKVMDKYKWASH